MADDEKVPNIEDWQMGVWLDRVGGAKTPDQILLEEIKRGISIDNAEPFSKTEYFSGKFEQYDFTLSVSDSGCENEELEITWIDDTPENAEMIEEQIKEHFYANR